MEVEMATMTLTVNGSSHTVDVDLTTPLLYVLSDDLNLRGPKFGCGLAQCGACLSGVILTAKALLDQQPHPTEAQMQEALARVLCRCFAHTRMLRALTRYAQGR